MALGVGVWGQADAPVAAGSGLPPTIQVGPRMPGRGESVTVAGEAFGDNCHDTGAPPRGQGSLGRPLEGIEVVMAQAPVEVVAARGAADGETYRSTVDVTVP